MFTANDLRNLTEGREKRKTPTFTEGIEKETSTFTTDDLPNFTEGREKIYQSTAVH